MSILVIFSNKQKKRMNSIDQNNFEIETSKVEKISPNYFFHFQIEMHKD